MQKKEQEVQKKDEVIAELLAARQSKTDHKQVHMSCSSSNRIVQQVCLAMVNLLRTSPTQMNAAESNNSITRAVHDWSDRPQFPMREKQYLKLLHSTCPACSAASFSELQGNYTSWDVIKATINGTGHKFCGLARDLWSCSGERYRQTLLQTRPYSSGMQRLPAGTRIFATGLSYMSEIIHAVVCEEATEVWAIGHLGGTLASFDNGMYILFVQRQTTGREQEALLNAFKPAFLVAGAFHNPVKMSSREVMASLITNLGSWKHHVSGVLELPENPLPKDCKAEFSGCSPGYGHQCLPGPLARSSEELILQLGECATQPSTCSHTGLT